MMKFCIIKQSTVFRVISFVLLLCLCFTSGCTSRKTIVNALDEKEANEILVFLSTKGIDAAKVRNLDSGGAGGSKLVLWDISVSADQSSEAMALLNQIGLPRRRGQSLLGIFANSGLVPSELQESIRYQAGLAEQIASTIRKIDGVLDAEVQISFPKEDPLNPGADKKKITASVYVKHSGVLDDPNIHLATKIKRLVAASITGLDYDNVTVIGDRARLTERVGASIFGSGDEAKQYVSVWTIILAKESVTRFQIIFFSFIILLLLLTLALIWLGWKLYPVLRHHGGLKELFHIRPIELDEKKPKSSAKVESEKTKTEEEADHEIDET